MSIACKVRPIGGEALLPDGYRRCEYLESTGAQWIATGIKLSNESEVKCEFMQIKASSQFVYAAGAVFALHVNDNIRFDYCGVVYNNKVETVLQRFRTIQNSTGGWINGEKKVSFPAVEAFETTQTTQIFAYNSSYRFIGRIYSFSISRNNLLQLNFIPCLDDKGKPCMFDTVSRTPYYNYNNGSGDFIYKLKAPLIRKLPRGYQPLEYLESTGTQYIDTGVKLSNESEVTCELMRFEASQNQYAFGAQHGSKLNQFGLCCYSVASPSMCYVYVRAVDVVGAANFEYNTNERFDIVINKEGFKVGDYSKTFNKVSTDFECDYPCYIFGECNFGSSRPATVRIYSFSISRAGVAQVDYVPCIAPNGKLGMYNKVDGTMKENDGTGAFIAGLATVDDVRTLWLPETSGELTVSVPAATPDSAVEQLRKNNPTWQIAIQYRQ